VISVIRNKAAMTMTRSIPGFPPRIDSASGTCKPGTFLTTIWYSTQVKKGRWLWMKVLLPTKRLEGLRMRDPRTLAGFFPASDPYSLRNVRCKGLSSQRTTAMVQPRRFNHNSTQSVDGPPIECSMPLTYHLK
jgi:hypothetical protein